MADELLQATHNVRTSRRLFIELTIDVQTEKQSHFVELQSGRIA